MTFLRRTDEAAEWLAAENARDAAMESPSP
jgi:hypothetical protein